MGAGSKGDAPTTSEWSTVLFPSKGRHILQVRWYVILCSYLYINISDKHYSNIYGKLLNGGVGFPWSIASRYYLKFSTQRHKRGMLTVCYCTVLTHCTLLNPVYCDCFKKNSAVENAWCCLRAWLSFRVFILKILYMWYICLCLSIYVSCGVCSFFLSYIFLWVFHLFRSRLIICWILS